MHTLSRGILIFVAALAVGCSDPAGNGGGDGGNTGDDGGNTGTDGGDTSPDGGNTGPDGGGGTPTCDPTNGPQCNNCIDDDGDGLIDGADPHCISALDDDESSFATGIPGDNVDLIWQDCFFDGNSGAGDDGCNQHVCCILGAPDKESCPHQPHRYDPNNCTLSQQCIDFCSPLSPPGCDCFGCCTVCHEGNCYDVYINATVAPECDLDVLGDPTKCPTCVKQECGTGDCGGCVLCPGQTEDDLPAECGGQNQCPGDSQPCDVTSDCGTNMFCSNGCCIHQIG
jgi:hypothetical protein